jgi:hypothetical protein
LKENASYPLNECKFVVQVEIEHEGGAAHKVKYDWFQNQNDKETLAVTEVETG